MTAKSTDLDFLDIKESLRKHFKKYDDYKDYDFEGSGLASIMDVLAYNTHINGLIANMAINESYLSSAQLRSSAVGHAETLGYVPKSRTSSTAYLTVTATSDTLTDPVTIPKGHVFFGELGDVSYRFVTTTDSRAVKGDDGVYRWSDVEVREGKSKKKSFVVSSETDAVYVVPDANIDTSTMVVSVKENSTTTEKIAYTNIETVATITPTSMVYMVKEIANGYYELFFSDGNVLGTPPPIGGVIEVEYLQSKGDASNGCENFSATVLDVDGTELSLSVGAAESGGGSDKESLTSIKLNAPRVFSAQQRLVTSDDYSALILSRFGNDVENVVSWGGADNIPPEYGKVFVSLDFRDGVDRNRQTEVKESIIADLTSHLSIMSIDTEFVNPAITYLEIKTIFNLDPVSKPDTTEGMQQTVQQFIVEYMKENLSTFGTIFRRSNLLSAIDSIHPSILNSRMDVKGQQRFIAFDPRPTNYEVQFPFALATPDKDDHVISTSPFLWQGSTVVIKNELGSHRLQIFNLDNQVEFKNIGYYDESLGKVVIQALEIDTNLQPVEIKVSASPANASTIKPLRNYIIELDETLSTSTALIDEETIKVSL